MTRPFKSNEDLFAFARHLRDALAAKGKADEARELSEVVDGFWSTASEALAEMLDSLVKVRGTVNASLPEMTVSLDEAVAEIKKAFERANNPDEWNQGAR